MNAVIYTKLILILFSSNFLYINNATMWNYQLKFTCEKFYKKGELKINCSYKNLSHIPDLPFDTVYLNLQHNLIIRIPNNTFKHMTNLKVLDLSFNRLQSMNDQTFNGLGNLMKLDLNNNMISGGMSNKVFESMKRLTDLDLSHNGLTRINEKTFLGLQNLQNLRLNDNELHYNISNIPTESFKPLESVTWLSIQNNNFARKIFPSYGIVFPDKTISDLAMLEILELDVNTGFGYDAILGKGFSYLKHLYSLSACNCQTFILESDTFKYTPNLTHVYFNHCSPRVYREKHEEFSKLMKLKVLQLNGWRSNDLDENELLALISGLSNTTIRILKMNYLFISFYSVPLSNLLNNISVVLNKTPIQELHFTNNLNVHFNELDMPVKVPPSLRTLNISDNSLEALKLNIKQVTSLHLEDNRLGNYLANNSLWIQNSKLEYVNLSNNSIYKLHTTIFIGQKYLRVIDLRFNFLKDSNFDMSSLVNLEILNLKNNKIKYLSDQSRMELDKVFKNNGNAKIDLSNNPLQCSCFTLPFLNWMRLSQKHFINYTQFRCTFENGSFSKPNSFEEVLLNLQRDCTNHLYLIISVSFSVLAFIAVLSAAVIYRHRWKLRYLFYTAKLKYTSHRNMEENLNEYVYDAFISYSENDCKFVIGDCIKHLERNGNMKLCIHHRDFIPGEEITQNIISAIQNSRKTICIISRSFLESYYCMFEFNMARMESVHSRNGKNVLFLVFYEKLLPEELPLILYELIQKQSYIEYPNHEHGNVIFWDKIKDAIHA
ncbi:toll-like receptor 4 [Mytilus galloprovincialis]|uniref:toll-like receptor 4 n=1 Tax=Mytilus galloprovincialis TaxID=29158 RepID=UPI003F7BD859